MKIILTKKGVYGRNYQPQDIPANYITHILCMVPTSLDRMRNS